MRRCGEELLAGKDGPRGWDLNMRWIVEHAGGTAITGEGRIFDVKPSELHQGIPVILGSRREAEVVARRHA
jgi:fructose-1,6-bisphosphatase I